MWCERGMAAKSPPPEPIAVDHDVEPEEKGAQPIGNDGKGAKGKGERPRADGAHQRIGLEAADPCRERGAYRGTGELVREPRAQLGLVFEERHRLRHQGRDREPDGENRQDEEDREDDRDFEAASHVLPFEPADGRAQRAGDEKSDDQHEEDGPELDQQPEGNGEENEHDQGLEG